MTVGIVANGSKLLYAFYETAMPDSVVLSDVERKMIAVRSTELIEDLHAPLRQGYFFGLVILAIYSWLTTGKAFWMLPIDKRRRVLELLVRSRITVVVQLYVFMAGIPLVQFYSLHRVWQELEYSPYNSSRLN